MDEEYKKALKHFGIPGMKWGRRKGANETSSSKKVSLEKSKNRKIKSFKKEEIFTGRNVVRGILLAYGALAVVEAVNHLQKHPIRVEVNYTKWPFKQAKTPFFKVKMSDVRYAVKRNRDFTRKLLPGG